jgi:DNA-binding MarR family transcriptional regulator
MWYFLRALWNEDGLTQRELSRRTGTTEPTALIAIQSMEKRGLVRRLRSHGDRRKWHVHLTAKGGRLKAELIPLAREVVETAKRGLTAAEITQLLKLLDELQKNVHAAFVGVEDPELDIAPAKRSRAASRKS